MLSDRLPGPKLRRGQRDMDCSKMPGAIIGRLLFLSESSFVAQSPRDLHSFGEHLVQGECMAKRTDLFLRRAINYGLFFQGLLFCVGCSTSSPTKVTDPNSILTVCTTRKPLSDKEPVSIPYQGFAIFAWFEKDRPDGLPEAAYLTRSDLVTEKEWKSLPGPTGKSRAGCSRAVEIHEDFEKVHLGSAAYVFESSAPWVWKYDQVLVFKRKGLSSNGAVEQAARTHIKQIADILGNLNLWGFVTYNLNDYEIDFLNFSNEITAKEAFSNREWIDFLKINGDFELIYSLGMEGSGDGKPERGKLTKILRRVNDLNPDNLPHWSPGDGHDAGT